jgi:LysM repeat protein
MIRLNNRTIQISLLLVLALLGTLFATAHTGVLVQASACRASVTVRPGDTLGKYAEKYNVRITDLTAANRLYAPYYTIYVGRKLCIPGEASPLAGVPTYATAPAADFSARLNGNFVEIKTSNFPKYSSYYVKATSGSVKDQKIGLLNTGSGGTKVLKLALPDKLSKAAQVTVCLKNNVTDANVCRLAKR